MRYNNLHEFFKKLFVFITKLQNFLHFYLRIIVFLQKKIYLIELLN